MTRTKMTTMKQRSRPMADKIDVPRLAREADQYADDFKNFIPEARDEHFARLVMEECAKVCEQEAATWEGDGVPEPMSRLCAMQIRSMKP